MAIDFNNFKCRRLVSISSLATVTPSIQLYAGPIVTVELVIRAAGQTQLHAGQTVGVALFVVHGPGLAAQHQAFQADTALGPSGRTGGPGHPAQRCLVVANVSVGRAGPEELAAIFSVGCVGDEERIVEYVEEAGVAGAAQAQ